MKASNRRGFLKIAGAGAAAVGAASLAPAVGSPTSSGKVTRAEAEIALPAAATGSMAAYVSDISTGEVSVMIEGREVTVTDHQLVARLAQVLHSPAQL